MADDCVTKVAERFAQEPFAGTACSFERAIHMTLAATGQPVFDLCKCGHSHVGGEICISCDCEEQEELTKSEYEAIVCARILQALEAEKKV